MELWIRSQDKECLIKTNIVEMEYFGENCFASINTRFDGKNASLGLYKTKERALEVLNEIQNILNLKDMYKYDRELVLKSWENVDEEQVKIVRQQMSVYEMPQE